jgi:hypothetical protein
LSLAEAELLLVSVAAESLGYTSDAEAHEAFTETFQKCCMQLYQLVPAHIVYVAENNRCSSSGSSEASDPAKQAAAEQLAWLGPLLLTVVQTVDVWPGGPGTKTL